MSRGWRESRREDNQRSRGGSNNRRWGYLFKFTKTPVRVHFSRPEKLYTHPFTGAEQPFRTGMRYFIKWAGKNGTYVERDDAVEGKNCIVDAYRNPAAFGLDMKPMSKFQSPAVKDANIYYAVAGWVEEWFHNVPKENEKTGAKWFERELCTGHGCEGCQKRHPKVFGKKCYFEIAKTHWNDAVFRWEEQINSQCKCNEDAFIYIPQYNCSECGHMLQDVMNNCFSCGSDQISLDTQGARAECEKCHANWSVFESDNKKLAEAVNSKQKCSECNHEGYPAPEWLCTHCGDKSEEYTIFDCQMKVCMTGGGDKAKEMTISDVMIQEPDEKLFMAKHQSDDPEWADKIAEGNKKPLNLDNLLRAPTPDEQAQRLNVANPFTSSGQSQGYKSYSRHQDEEGSGQEESSDDQPQEEEEKQHPPKGRAIAGRPRPSFRR